MYAEKWFHRTPTTRGNALVCARKHLAQQFHKLVAKCKEASADVEARKHSDGYYRQDLLGAETRAREELVAFCAAAEDMILNGYTR